MLPGILNGWVPRGEPAVELGDRDWLSGVVGDGWVEGVTLSTSCRRRGKIWSCGRVVELVGDWVGPRVDGGGRGGGVGGGWSGGREGGGDGWVVGSEGFVGLAGRWVSCEGSLVKGRGVGGGGGGGGVVWCWGGSLVGGVVAVGVGGGGGEGEWGGWEGRGVGGAGWGAGGGGGGWGVGESGVARRD